MAMTDQEMEREIKSIKVLVSEIHAVLMMKEIKPDEVNRPLFDKALREFMGGNPKMLDQYFKQGGKAPREQGG